VSERGDGEGGQAGRPGRPVPAGRRPPPPPRRSPEGEGAVAEGPLGGRAAGKPQGRTGAVFVRG